MLATLKPALAALLLLGASEACSSPHAALPECTWVVIIPEAGVPDGDIPEGGVPEAAMPDSGIWTCPGTMTCGYSGPAADGQCHGVALVCAIPCQTNADCAPLGETAICSSQCGSPVCTPYQ